MGGRVGVPLALLERSREVRHLLREVGDMAPQIVDLSRGLLRVRICCVWVPIVYIPGHVCISWRV